MRRFPRHIIFWVLLPVVVVGVTISALLIAFFSPSMVSFLERHFDANLRLASDMGLGICESHLGYLLELRLENNPDMNLALKNEALKEIAAISARVPDVHMLILENGRTQTAASDKADEGLAVEGLTTGAEEITTCMVGRENARAHVRYFPFWDWYIVSYVFEQDFSRPLNTAFRIIYLGTSGVLVSVLLTLLWAYLRFVNTPLKRLISATKGVSEGRFHKMDEIADNELGQLTAAFNSMIDSLETEKKEVRSLIRQLQISESQFRALFENAPVGICLAHPQGNVLKHNQAMQTLLGLQAPEISDARIGSFFANPGEYREILSRLGRERTIINHETHLKHPGSGSCQVRMIMSLMQSDRQELVLAIIEDITEQKRLENQLNQARKLEAIGSLAGGIAHDFNNLLSPILGYGELLLDDLGPQDEHCASVQEIINASLKARDIVRQLLAFSRKQTLEFKTLDLNEIITGYKKLLRRAIREDIAIEIDVAPTALPVRADGGQLGQILMNLAVNSQDAMPQGGRIIIETSRVELDEHYAANHQSVVPGRYVLLAVSDTGHGMDTEILEKIFDPFFTTKEKGSGTGFGLATVYGIVKQHNGYVWVYSEPGQGATFKIYFPVVDDVREIHSSKEVERNLEDTGGGTILVVEDDSSVLDMVTNILRRKGYRVLPAASAAECLGLIESLDSPVDLLLTDVIMPEMNGRELYLQVIKRYPQMAVLFMSGYTDNVIAHHGVLEEGILFIQKPFSSKDLLNKVHAVLNARCR